MILESNRGCCSAAAATTAGMVRNRRTTTTTSTPNRGGISGKQQEQQQDRVGSIIPPLPGSDSKRANRSSSSSSSSLQRSRLAVPCWLLQHATTASRRHWTRFFSSSSRTPERVLLWLLTVSGFVAFLIGGLDPSAVSLLLGASSSMRRDRTMAADFPRVVVFVDQPIAAAAPNNSAAQKKKTATRLLRRSSSTDSAVSTSADSTGVSGAAIIATTKQQQQHREQRRLIDPPMSSPRDQEHLKKSKEYNKNRVEEWETAECKAQYDWQLKTFPSCNLVHEYDLSHPYFDDGDKKGGNDDIDDERVRVVNNGYWRDVWIVRDGDEHSSKRVLKTIRYEHKMTPRNFDRHRRDALAMERLTGSPYVMDIYAFCGNSGLFEYSSGGDLNDALFPASKEEGEDNNEQPNKLTQLQKLKMAYEAAAGLAAVHNVDREGRASIAHTDISPGQFLLMEDGRYKLNDFNRARFLRWNLRKNRPCPYRVAKNPGKNRSPEEYAYEEQSEMVDVYSLGNVFYMLLTGDYPFYDISSKGAAKRVKEGYRPSIYMDVWNSTDAVDRTLKEVMVLSHAQDPTERATARKLETILGNKLRELDPTTTFL